MRLGLLAPSTLLTVRILYDCERRQAKMRSTLSQLLNIIKHPEKYASKETYLAHIEQKTSQIISELQHIKKTRFKEGKFYCSHFTKEERWGSM